LQERDPDSASAMFASYALVRFAHTNARLYSSQEPKWIEEFSRQARMFAGRYPEESGKALPLLSAAAVTAELHGNRQEAIACHTLLAEKFPESPQGKFSVGVLRRLNLEGQPLEFAGPTLEGDFITLEDYKDKVVLIVFWSTEDEDFLKQLPGLLSLYEKYHKFGFEVIGVNMDEDETVLNTWLEDHTLPWRQIFFAEKAQRSWRNPVAQYYGVNTIPTMWLVDDTGVVKESQIDASTLEAPLRELLLALRNKTNSGPVGAGGTNNP
jgi:peroxiredoxin